MNHLNQLYFVGESEQADRGQELFAERDAAAPELHHGAWGDSSIYYVKFLLTDHYFIKAKQNNDYVSFKKLIGLHIMQIMEYHPQY